MEGEYNPQVLFNNGLDIAKQQLQAINKLSINIMQNMYVRPKALQKLFTCVTVLTRTTTFMMLLRQKVSISPTCIIIINPSITCISSVCGIAEYLHNLCEFLQQTGVGATDSSESQQTPWDEHTAATAAHLSYAQRLRIQENAAVVANLLGSHALAS